ncbi:MAG: acyloxyacyl hydrolase [Bacteroidota bacterium]
MIKKRLFFLLFFVSFSVFSQTKKYTHAVYADFLYGQIMPHSPNIIHLIQGSTSGFVAGWKKQTYGHQEWEQQFNYPSYGASFMMQNMGSPELGNVYSLHADYNFYFFKRQLVLGVGTGIGYVPNKYDKRSNPRNVAYGSTLLSSSIFKLNYQKEQAFGLPIDFSLGAFLIHYSNGKSKSPNTSTNNFGLQFGLTYHLDKDEIDFIDDSLSSELKEPFRFNVALLGGANDNGIVGEPRYPFLAISTYIDKRLNRKSSIQLGTDLFLNQAVKKHLEYNEIIYPDEFENHNKDWKRVGLFVGHELFFRKMSLITQMGYYVYYPYDYLNRIYTRVGVKRYLSNRFFVSVALKTHFAKAEAIEYGIGIRL